MEKNNETQISQNNEESVIYVKKKKPRVLVPMRHLKIGFKGICKCEDCINKKNINTSYMRQSIILQEHINSEKLFYLYSLPWEKITKYVKKDKEIKYYTEVKNILSDYVLKGKSINEKTYSVSDTCNRLYCNSSLQKLQNDITNFLLPDNCYDYDITCARPSVSRYLSKINDLPYDKIDYYIKNRSTIIEKSGKTKAEIKELHNKIANVDKPYSSGVKEIDDYVKQESKNKLKLLQIYKDLIPKKDDEKVDKQKNPISSAYCELYYYFEEQLVRMAVDKFKENVNCIKFDGFISRKELDINELNKLTKEFEIEWTVKPLETKFKLGYTDFAEIDEKLHDHLYGKFKISIFNLKTSSELAEKASPYLKHTIRYCNEKWFVLDSKTKLWDITKEPLYYFIKILKIGLNKSRDDLYKEIKAEEAKPEEERNETTIKSKNDELGSIFKGYQTIDKPGFCSQLKSQFKTLLKDNNFEKNLDNNLFCLAFTNGILDMRTGTFRGGIYGSDYLTKTIDYDYVPLEQTNNDHIEFFRKEWKKIMNYNDEHFDYFMKHLAYALTGDSDKYQTFYFCVGQLAGNGKSSIFETLQKIFPAYVANVNSQLLEEDYAKRHKLMIKLKSNRIVYLNEMKKKKKISADIMKKISDGLTEDNEVMYGTSEEFKIQATAFLLTNHMPDFDNMDSGVYRRYEHVQFDSEFDVNNKYNLKEDDYENKKFIADNGFCKKMVDKKHGLIHLLIEYSKKCINEPLPKMPQEFKEEKELMKSVNDEVKNWLEDVIVVKESLPSKIHLAKMEIIERYKSDKNLKLDSKTLLDIMKQLGYKNRYVRDTAKKGFGKGVFKGLQLRPAEEKVKETDDIDKYAFSDDEDKEDENQDEEFDLHFT